MNWGTIYPTYFDSTTGAHRAGHETKNVEFADVGCGFGGLLMQLAPLFPDTLMLGLEIRVHVTQYVHDKIVALRLAAQRGRIEDSDPQPQPEASSTQATDEDLDEATQNAQLVEAAHLAPGSYDNVGVLRANGMKFLPNFFTKHQLSKLFFLFPTRTSSRASTRRESSAQPCSPNTPTSSVRAVSCTSSQTFANSTTGWTNT